MPSLEIIKHKSKKTSKYSNIFKINQHKIKIKSNISNKYRNRGGGAAKAAPPPLFGYLWDVFDFILNLF